jgi:tetratricopeptide (TPR) repeat protein
MHWYVPLMFAPSRAAAAGFRTALLLTALAFTSPARAAVPTADTSHVDPPPAPLLTPPRAHGPAISPEDTAIAGARRRARADYGKGIALEQQKAYAAAIISYMNAARLDPTLRGASFRVGRLFASRRQWDPAARAFREELRRNPDDRAAEREYALMLVELGDTTRPARMLSELTRRAPADPTLWRALGFTYARLGRYAEAEKALRGAVALNRRYALAWRDLGVVLTAEERPREAREAYRTAFAADPEDAATIVNLANLESEEGQHARAFELYHQAEKLDSLQGLAYQGQVRELVALGREADAGTVWRRWLVRSPYDIEVRESAARHFVRQRRPDIALEVAREGVRITPHASEVWWLLGEMHAQSGDTLSAASAFQDARRRSRQPASRERAEASLAALRAAASEPLRARWPADSVDAVPSDTTRAPGR